MVKQYTSDNFEPGQIVLFPQALDNQWVPRSLLPSGAKFKKPVSRAAILNDINRAARSEYIHALLSANKVVLNRAYCINSPVVTRDYQYESSNHALQTLLNEGVIVPFLFSEKSLSEAPPFDHDENALRAWTEITEKSDPIVLRLSWNDEENNEQIRYRISRRFHELCDNLSGLNPYALHDSLNLPYDNDTISRFKATRKDLKQFALECDDLQTIDGRMIQRFVTRQQIYEKFICQDGSKVSEGLYDLQKPFAWQIKELVDLAYNVNLPDLLSGQLLTPAHTINRSALQEIQAKAGQEIEPEHLLELIRGIVVDEAIDVLKGLSQGFDLSGLQLEDVVLARNLSAWSDYNESLRSLANANYMVSDGAATFNANTIHCADRYQRFLERLQTELLNQSVEREMRRIGITGNLGMTFIAHLSGMEWWQVALSHATIEGITHSAIERLKQLGSGKKQFVLSLAFWSTESRSNARRNLFQIDVINKKLDISGNRIQTIFDSMQTIARDKTMRFNQTKDLESNPDSNSIAARESAD